MQIVLLDTIFCRVPALSWASSFLQGVFFLWKTHSFDMLPSQLLPKNKRLVISNNILARPDAVTGGHKTRVYLKSSTQKRTFKSWSSLSIMRKKLSVGSNNLIRIFYHCLTMNIYIQYDLKCKACLNWCEHNIFWNEITQNSCHHDTDWFRRFY